MNIKKLVLISILLSITLMLSYIESIMSINIAIPGFKFGLANISILISYFLIEKKFSFLILFLKSIFIFFFTGNIIAFFLSISGSFFSFIAIVFCIKLNEMKYIDFGVIGISVLSAQFHVIGQLISAMIILKSSIVWYYFPILSILSIFTGFFVGYLAYIVIKNYIKMNKEILYEK